MKKRIVILGGGESGTGAAVLALREGYAVMLSDLGKIPQANKALLSEKNIEFEEQRHTQEKILQAELIVKSPGIPDTAPIVKLAGEKNIPVISEIEFAARRCKVPIFAVTGSNGKTTTALLIHHILKNAGLNTGLAGNVGKSFARQLVEHDFDYYVLEVSSFQLDGIVEFHPHIAVLLNITPDHLDRYNNDMQPYIDSKFRIIENAGPEDFLVYCADDPVLIREISKRSIKAQLIPFSVKKKLEYGAYKTPKKIIINMKQNSFEADLNALSLSGDHNVYNSMAAGVVAKLNEVRSETLRAALSDFKNADHRLEQYISVGGVKFINDSKATNINSTWYALHSINSEVVLIIGGLDKGNDYSVIKDLVRRKVKALVCIGKDNSKIIDAFLGMTELYESDDMSDAVRKAHELAEEGDTVLLSPACASQDRFKNYEDRGEQYKAAVREL